MRTYEELWAQLAPIGRDRHTQGYQRFAYGPAELACREWFTSAAADRGLVCSTDRNGNLWARWSPPAIPAGTPALVIGSHLDSVPDGGAFDGPLGVVSALVAIDILREHGHIPTRPLAIVAFADEEGAPFGIACAGSRLLTGALDPQRARELTGRDGRTMAEAMADAGHDPDGLGRDDALLRDISCYLELHIEQGRSLIDLDAPLGVASSIWPHGRFRFTLTGEANHAGTTAMSDRRDPMIAFAHTALAARAAASRADLRTTFGRLAVHPNGTNAIAHEIRAWLDARAATPAELDALVGAITQAAEDASAANGTCVTVTAESVSGATTFDAALTADVASIIAADSGQRPPVIATGAGHDAGVLADAGIPSAMIFVRNPTGISHSPEEFAEPADCHAGVRALAATMEHLTR